MKAQISKTLLLGLLLAPTHLLAQDASVASTKTSPIHNILPTAYGKLDLRQYTKQKDSFTMMLQPRLILGSKWFDDRLQSEFIFGVENKYGSKQEDSLVTDKGTRMENEFTAYKNDYIKLIPLLYIEFPKSTDTEKKGTKTEFGIDIPVEYPIHTAAGLFTLEGESISKTYLGTRLNDDDFRVSLRDNEDRAMTIAEVQEKAPGLTDAHKTRMGLTDDKGQAKVHSSGRSFYQWFSVGASYKPSYIAGLTTRVLSIHETTYTPSMQFDEATNTSKSTRKFERKYDPSYLFHVKYELTPAYSITNEFSLMARDANDNRKYSNMVSVVAKLF